MIERLTPREHYIFTSESVSEGHPDKVCDQISDAMVDAMLSDDPYARVAVETLATTNLVVVAGEVRGSEKIYRDQVESIVRKTVKDIGYQQDGFDWEKLEIINRIHGQSPDIAQGVDSSGNKDEGAGDQGIMFGFACDETEHLMPAPIGYANEILKHLSVKRHAGELPQLGPDAKSQVSLVYEKGRPVRADSVVVSTQHRADVAQEEVHAIVKQAVESVLPKGWMCPPNRFYVNPTGKFVIGGPDGDAGLTGRKIIVDTYGGAAPHGGGAFSGKDPTKVDRSAAYMARYLAKNVVAAGLASRCTIQLSYAIGVSHPISFYVTTHGTGLMDTAKLEKMLPEMVDLSPRGIREHLKLNQPIYAATAAYGHFGREPDGAKFSWERLDLAQQLKQQFAA